MQYQKTEKKDFLGMKDFREGHAMWLADHGWSQDYRWDKQNHSACPITPGGKWILRGYGFFLGTDWVYRLYSSHQCPKCGTMVQHTQACDENGHGAGLISRNVFLP